MSNITKHDFQVNRHDRTKLNGHNSLLIWFTGLSGSGKSTIANALETALHNENIHTYVLDGDNVRHGLNEDLDFTEKGRNENIRRIAEVSNLMVDAGLVVLAAFVSPFKKEREKIKQIVGKSNFIEVYISTSIEACEKRDVKGLYKMARENKIDSFTGISSPYEKPESPDVTIDTEKLTVKESVDLLMGVITPKLTIKE